MVYYTRCVIICTTIVPSGAFATKIVIELLECFDHELEPLRQIPNDTIIIHFLKRFKRLCVQQ